MITLKKSKEAKTQKWYFTVEAKNGEIVATSEMYKTKAGAKKGIQALGTTLLYDILFGEIRCEEEGKKYPFFLPIPQPDQEPEQTT
jgi:uncharacterized protein YegP (UPF0339 family)